jgi:hypothetical protein
MTNLGLQIELPLMPVYPPEDKYGYYNDPEKTQGWIGLLNCRVGTNTELPGIVLLRARQSTAVQVKRIVFGTEPSKHTVLVGAKVAAQAVPTKITIIQDDESGAVRSYHWLARQIIINESLLNQNIGYYVSTASGSNIKQINWAFQYYSIWNSRTKILTLPGPTWLVQDLISINFQSRKSCPDPEFSIFIRGSHALVRKGSSFSNAEQRQIYDWLKRYSQRDDTEDVILKANDGKKVRIVVEVRLKKVCHWDILEVDVDNCPAGTATWRA